MKNIVRAFVLVVAGIGFGAALAVDSASAADTVKVRKSVMKELSGHNKAIKKYLKGHKDPKKASRLGTAGDVELRAIAVAGLAKRMTSYFPKGTSIADLGKATRAKAEIWTDWSAFQAEANALAKEAGKLEAAAATGDKAKIAGAMKTFGKVGCGGCHKKFRGPKAKKKKSS